jgi:TfoX/Sxy family transcriptional regulator of competence genes
VKKIIASEHKFVDFVIEQIGNVGKVTAKKMFGEYAINAEGKLFVLIGYKK